MANWVIGILMSLLSLLGLFLASHAVDMTMGWVGILMFTTCLAFVYGLIIKNT